MLYVAADPDGGLVGAPRIEVRDSSRGSFPFYPEYETPDRQIVAAGPVCGNARTICSGVSANAA
jgi:hypothetical protein